jgi:hypothetical protein
LCDCVALPHFNVESVMENGIPIEPFLQRLHFYSEPLSRYFSRVSCVTVVVRPYLR